jgi:hypothetical protein
MNSKLNRREFIYTGLVGGLGLSLGEALRAQSASSKNIAAQSIIHIFLPGGIAAQETWDPHPLAPSEYKGPLGVAQTKIPGVYFSEYLKQTAKIADKLTVVRSMTHGEAAHERGVTSMFTGYRPSPALEYPSFGSVVAHELGDRNDLPAYVCVPQKFNLAGIEPADTGYLSKAYGPFSLGSDPADKNFKVRDLNLPAGIDDKRFDRRRSMLETVDAHFRSIESSDVVASMDSFYQKAYSLISAPHAREAFNLDKEPAKMKEFYGNNQAGQRFLMARRLVEAGVRFVSVTYGSWDMHQGIGAGITRQLPAFDQAYAALITDLEQRGLLDSTLVMVSSEFGRTPKINKDGGRDHWPRVFSVAFAGGGFKRGYVYGSSDATGADVEENPLHVADLAATLYNQIGIDPSKKLVTPDGRPVALTYEGDVKHELLA